MTTDKLLIELELLAKQNSQSEIEANKRIASIIFVILAAYHSDKLPLLNNITSHFVKKERQEIKDKKASLN